MQAPSQILRVVFALSTWACSVILVLFQRGRAAPEGAFWWEVGGASVLLSALVCALVFRRGGLRLGSVAFGDVFFVFLRSLLVAYVGCAAVITGVGFALLYSLTHTAPHAFALAGLAGVWLSLWLAPAVASVGSWRRLVRRSVA